MTEIRVAEGASLALLGLIRARGYTTLRVVADKSTLGAGGAAVGTVLDAAKDAGIGLGFTVFDPDMLVAGAESVFRLMLDLGTQRPLLIALGSGTITDIVRFVAHRADLDFVCLPTAPSVDAYSSVVAPLVVGTAKVTVPAKAPVAIFAEPSVLAAAPAAMIAAGFGDMVCKFSAVADWRLGSLLWDESFDEVLAQRSLAAASMAVEAAPKIGIGSPEGVRVLFEALLESGTCMALAGHSKPASGAEHQYSHFWEMKLLREGRQPILHGLKVALGTLIVAGYWDRLRDMTREEAKSLMEGAALPDREAELEAIRLGFGQDAPTILGMARPFLDMDAGSRRALGAKVLGNWEEVRSIAAGVPSAKALAGLLETVHCPTEAAALGLESGDMEAALALAHYVRDRFTVRKLAWLLGLA